MSHARKMSTAATYLRLLAYVKPYWKVLTIGLVAGMLVGSSLFVTLMLLPKMVGAVEVQQSAVAPAAGKKGELLPATVNDPKLQKLLSQAESAIRQFHLPARIEGRQVVITWPAEYTFDIVDAKGCMAWQLVTSSSTSPRS